MIDSREESIFVHSKTLGTIFWLNVYRSFASNYKAKGCLFVCLCILIPSESDLVKKRYTF